MQIIDQAPSLTLGKQNDQFVGCSANIIVNKATIAKPNGNKVYFLRLFGDVEFSLNNRIINMKIGITESDLGPLFVNKGKSDFFIYPDGALSKLMDAMGIIDVAEFNGKKLPIMNNQKGFWVIHINGFKKILN